MFLQQLINALTIGSLYALTAMGATLIYGILGILDIANAGAYLVGAYVGWYVYYATGNIVLAFLVFYSRLMLNLIGDYESKLKMTAHTDRLTGLYNRHYMMTELETSAKEEKMLFAAMVDIDDFKKINDTYGHNAGDYVLVNVARIMREVCKDCRISRWGGEEFLIMSSGKDRGNFLSLIEALRNKVSSEDFAFGDDHIKVTITAGVAEHTADTSVDKWVKAADDNLYTGKRTCKNKVVS